MTTIGQIINQMVKNKELDRRELWQWSWGDRDRCAHYFASIFSQVDGTMDSFVFLPEYEQIIDWMTATNDKGLLLIGDCGRGKSVILNYVLPVLFRMHNYILHPIHAQDLYKPLPNQPTHSYYQRPTTYLDQLQRLSFPAIDELGVEGLMNDYGERTEGFNLILNAAERYHRPVFVTTNLSEQQILNRYGERTADRLAHLCRVIHFKGESLRR